MTTFLRWLNGWRLFIAAVIFFLAHALLAIAADLHRQSKCLLWDREPSNPDTAIAAILVSSSSASSPQQQVSSGASPASRSGCGPWRRHPTSPPACPEHDPQVPCAG